MYAKPDVRLTGFYQDATVKAKREHVRHDDAGADLAVLPLALRSRTVDRAVAEKQLRRSLEIDDDTRRIVYAADPADQRRKPHLLERARDGEVAWSRWTLVHDAR